MRVLSVLLIVFFMISTTVSQTPGLPAKTTTLFGEIRVDGKLLEKGRILFYSRDGQILGCIIQDGKYQIKRPNVGLQAVTIDGQGVAEKYNVPEKSNLLFKVDQDTDNFCDFDLKSK
jgi:hypothetical protein